MIQILDDHPIKNAMDSVLKESFFAKIATALGAIADPIAIDSLSRLVSAPGSHNDRPRPAAADALIACLATTPPPHDVDDAVLAALLETIRKRNDSQLNAELHLAYGQLARQLAPARRDDARRRLAETTSACDDTPSRLARQIALVLATDAPDAATTAALRPLIHAGLTEFDYDHEHTVHNIRIALRAAAAIPQLIQPTDLMWLTRFAEPDIRARAHALLDQLHHSMPPARCFDARSARALDDDELVDLIDEPHLIGRADLIHEAVRRDLQAARPAILRAVEDVMRRAHPERDNLLLPDVRILDRAIAWLAEGDLDAATIELFDRLLRHTNGELKRELLKDTPADPRLLGAMFFVLCQRWNWHEDAARDWLRGFEGTPAFDAAHRRAGSPPLELDQEDDDEDDAGVEDDDEMN